MADEASRYEIFIKSVARFTGSDPAPALWSWRRLNADGRIIADGGGHPSLEASFASVKRRAALFGEAPVKINLREDVRHVSPLTPPDDSSRPNSAIVDRDSVRRHHLANRVPGPFVLRKAVPIAARSVVPRLAAQRWVHPASPRQTRRS